jgi:hypothetical protein
MKHRENISFYFVIIALMSSSWIHIEAQFMTTAIHNPSPSAQVSISHPCYGEPW